MADETPVLTTTMVLEAAERLRSGEAEFPIKSAVWPIGGGDYIPTGKLMIGREALRLRFGEQIEIINERREIRGMTGLLINDAEVAFEPKPGQVLRVREEGGRVLIDETQESTNG